MLLKRFYYKKWSNFKNAIAPETSKAVQYLIYLLLFQVCSYKSHKLLHGEAFKEYTSMQIITWREKHWAVNYTNPQSFKISFSYSLAQQLWGFLLNFDWFVHWNKCPNIEPLIVKGNFLFHHGGCTSIYPPLSYPWKYLRLIHQPSSLRDKKRL